MSDTMPHIDNISAILTHRGFQNGKRLSQTLQGSIWVAEPSRAIDAESVVFKVGSQYLHKHKMAVVDHQTFKVHEDILMEKNILKYLTENDRCPESIVKFKDFFQTTNNYYLAMENGGNSLFDFIQKAHGFVANGKIAMTEWHKTCKIMFKQMIESIEYIHSKNICHFDISLENYLVNDMQITVDKNKNIKFETNDIKVKLCDFGLAQMFTKTKCHSKRNVGKTGYKSPELLNKKKYDAKKNDIWCLGVCLYMMIFGLAPWQRATKSDQLFVLVMNGHLGQLLKNWNKLRYIDQDLLHLFQMLFKFESQRADLNEIKNCRWLSN